MSEKKVSGVRTDLDPIEFAKKAGISRGSTRETKIKNFFKNAGEILSSLGLFPVFNASSNFRANKGYDENEKYQSSGKSFKENYQVEQTQPHVLKQTYTERIQEEEYLRSAGFTRDDLVLTEEEYIQRKQEDAYYDSLPGFRKKDCDHDER